jgi:hypothetical protein
MKKILFLIALIVSVFVVLPNDLIAQEDGVPQIEVTSHQEGDLIYGMVEVRGTVIDDNLFYYNTFLKDPEGLGAPIVGPGAVETEESFTDKVLFTFDTNEAGLIEGKEYTIWLEAQDNSGNEVLETVNVIVSPPSAPEDLEDCKDSGWQDYQDPSFDNPCECVRYVLLSKVDPSLPLWKKMLILRRFLLRRLLNSDLTVKQLRRLLRCLVID